MAIAEHGVVIAGGGPTGLMLAGELALAGVDVPNRLGRLLRSAPPSKVILGEFLGDTP